MYDRILVPVDGPPDNNTGVTKALDLASRYDAEIIALHVIQAERIASVPMESAWPGVVSIARQEGESVIEAIEALLAGSDVSVQTELREGSPSREIVRSAYEYEPDLIVMATSGRVGLNRLLLGSVTERVVRQSPVPVLTVRRHVDALDESSIDANVTP